MTSKTDFSLFFSYFSFLELNLMPIEHDLYSSSLILLSFHFISYRKLWSCFIPLLPWQVRQLFLRFSHIFPFSFLKLNLMPIEHDLHSSNNFCFNLISFLVESSQGALSSLSTPKSKKKISPKFFLWSYSSLNQFLLNWDNNIFWFIWRRFIMFDPHKLFPRLYRL